MGAGWPQWTVLAVAGAGILRSLYRLIRAVLAKLSPVNVIGQVLAMHPFNPQLDDEPRWYQLIVDDVVSDRTRPWLIRTDFLGTAAIGALVRIRAQPWTRYGLALEVLSAPAAGDVSTVDKPE